MIIFLWIVMTVAYGITFLVLVLSMAGVAGFATVIPLWAILGTVAGSAASLLTSLKNPRP